ncbi:MAG: hypothetical protein HRF44_12615 [Ignavibacterium sp.]
MTRFGIQPGKQAGGGCLPTAGLIFSGRIHPFPLPRVPTIARRFVLCAVFFGILTGHAQDERQKRLPVLSFPQPEIDDPKTYAEYETRFFTDSKENTLQILFDRATGRVVHLWADAANESLSFTARDEAGRPARLDWDSRGVWVHTRGDLRLAEYRLKTIEQKLHLGHILLCSMRKEREFQYNGLHLQPFDSPPFQEPELKEFLGLLEDSPPADRVDFLAALEVSSSEELHARLSPVVSESRSQSTHTIRFRQSSFDGRNVLQLDIEADSAGVAISRTSAGIVLRSRQGGGLTFSVRIASNAPALTPLKREEIFRNEFLEFLEDAARSGMRKREVLWLDRQVKSLELLSSAEKLMAGLPNFATYFGRDMIMSMLMLEPVIAPSLHEHALRTILGKLSPRGEVSHEESLGGQAIRENIGTVNKMIKALAGKDPDSEERKTRSAILALLKDLQKTREDYKMLDDDFQFPVLVARYLQRTDVPSRQKRAFLQQEIHGVSVEKLILRNLDYVCRTSLPYARKPSVTNLIAFSRRTNDSWLPASWRDSNAGYANGKYAMDINAIWVPAALEAVRTILDSLESLGIRTDGSSFPELSGSPLAEFMSHRENLLRAEEIWRDAAKHFEVVLDSADFLPHIARRLNGMGTKAREYWLSTMDQISIPSSLRFLALSLDSLGSPLAIPHTDVGMMLFLRDISSSPGGGQKVGVLLNPVITRFPVGLFVDGLGPLVANDSYAPPAVWAAFDKDRYHSPYTVWGREVNLLLLGIRNQKSMEPGIRALLDSASAMIATASERSGLSHNELWTYEIQDGVLAPVRYPTGSDIQLWNLTDLALRFLQWRDLHRN